MTKISGDSPTIRETHALYRGVPIVVELYGGFMKMRLKGKQQAWALDYEVALELCFKLEAREKGIKV